MKTVQMMKKKIENNQSSLSSKNIMKKESDCPREDRFLPLIAEHLPSFLPTKSWIEKRFEGSPILSDNRDVLKKYYNWSLGENEIIIYTGYGYCNLPVPQSYNYLLLFKDHEKSHSLSAKIKFAFWNGQIPLSNIERGHHTHCIMEFEGGTPDELKDIPSWEEYNSGKYDYLNIALCNKEDAELIFSKHR